MQISILELVDNSTRVRSLSQSMRLLTRVRSDPNSFLIVPETRMRETVYHA